MKRPSEFLPLISGQNDVLLCYLDGLTAPYRFSYRRASPSPEKNASGQIGLMPLIGIGNGHETL